MKIFNNEPFVPYIKPEGMSDDDFQQEISKAQNLHDQWVYEHMDELRQQTEENMWYHILNEEKIRYSNTRDL